CNGHPLKKSLENKLKDVEKEGTIVIISLSYISLAIHTHSIHTHSNTLISTKLSSHSLLIHKENQQMSKHTL
ncbi:hypothetical protein QHH03_32135, partial [Aphanizomenon sp. 202]|nr:hypothetical protein [Aphanizomenon sp. 202]